MTKRGMGRGLAAILPESGIGEPQFRHVPVELIGPNPDQPRPRFNPASFEGLAASVGDAGGVQPVIVRPLADGRYELIAGERRWRAARQAKLETVPALIRNQDEAERLQTALIENMAREDLNPLVEALGLSKEELARRLGRSRAAISNLVRLLDLPDEALELLAGGELTEGHGRAILQVQGADARRDIAPRADSRVWSVRETERHAKHNGGAGRAKVVPHPDQEAALVRAEEALEEALGTGIRVRALRRGIRAELQFDDLEDLLAFARSRNGC